MNTKLLHSIALVSILLALISLSGCTLIGMAIGHSEDKAARKKATGPPERIIPFKSGRSITVTYTNGQEMTGVYQGLRERAASEYIPLYDDARANLFKAILPAVGDTLTVALWTGKVTEAPLAGFGLQRMWLKSPKENSLTNIPLNDITRISDNRGVAFDSVKHRTTMAEKGMPSVMTILLRQDSIEIHIPTDVISQVHVHGKTHYRLLGGGIGLIIDYAVLRLLWHLFVTDFNISLD